MAYNRKGYFLRAQIIQEITARYYEPENHAKCLRAVWRQQIHPRFGIGYRAFLTYYKINNNNFKDNQPIQLKLFDITPYSQRENQNGTEYQPE